MDAMAAFTVSARIKTVSRFDEGGRVMAIYGVVIETPQHERGGNTDRRIPNDGRSLSFTPRSDIDMRRMPQPFDSSGIPRNHSSPTR